MWWSTIRVGDHALRKHPSSAVPDGCIAVKGWLLSKLSGHSWCHKHKLTILIWCIYIYSEMNVKRHPCTYTCAGTHTQSNMSVRERTRQVHGHKLIKNAPTTMNQWYYISVSLRGRFRRSEVIYDNDFVISRGRNYHYLVHTRLQLYGELWATVTKKLIVTVIHWNTKRMQ